MVVDDGGYGMLRFDQRHAGEPTFGVDLDTPDFVALAEAFGIRATRSTAWATTSAPRSPRTLAIPADVLVARAALEPPPTTSPRWYRRTG